MPISITVPTDDPRLVRTALAPAAEAMLSLHVLLDAKRHPLQHPWVRAGARAAGRRCRREVRALAFFYVDALPDCFLPESEAGVRRRARAASGAHARGRRLRARAAALPLLRPRAPAGPSGWPTPACAATCSTSPAARRRRRRRAEPDLRRPRGAAQTASWTCSRLLGGGLRGASGSGSSRGCARRPARCAGARRARAACWPARGAAPRASRSTPTRARSCAARRTSTRSATEERPLLLVPERLRLAARAGQLRRAVAARAHLPGAGRRAPARAAARPDELRARRSARSATRRGCGRCACSPSAPRSAEELAPLVGISEAGLSKHLRALAEAGLVRTRRDGYYVLYEADLDRLRALGPELLDWAGPG